MDCYFCQRNIKEVDFKEIELLRKFVSGTFKIRARSRTGVCAKHQKKLARAIKQARHIGILPSARK
ncbi:MAG: 30S ribosomal protein S18 [bacterium]